MPPGLVKTVVYHLSTAVVLETGELLLTMIRYKNTSQIIILEIIVGVIA